MRGGHGGRSIGPRANTVAEVPDSGLVEPGGESGVGFADGDRTTRRW
ncbi:hypothetical protein SSCG_02142 [Streptomyces clavuligerus]|nr:hypothetical protein SSCG_02142 [Streptomyces clavuligerus]